jgi:hypothetical protein
MTLAPRVEVYTKIACRTLYDSSSPPPGIFSSSPLQLPALPYTSGVVHVQFQDSPIKKFDKCAADPRVQARAARIQACGPSSSVPTVLTLMGLIPPSCQNNREYS